MTHELEIDTPPLTKTLVTVGPACDDPDTLRAMVDAGVRVFRLNFSHGSPTAHAESVRRIRAIEAAVDRPLAILGDLQGPRLRVVGAGEEGVVLEAGDRVIFRRDVDVGDDTGAAHVLGCTHPSLVDEIETGQRVLIHEGRVRLLIIDAREQEFDCRVTHAGLVTEGKGINLPDTDLSVAALSERDWTWVSWALEHGLDLLAQSFVRRASEVRALAEGLDQRAREAGEAGLRPAIVAKIEHPMALGEIDDILEAADGIMIARGDLGVEIDLARVPIVQKELTHAAQAHGKPCIVATQMLETMIESPIPTRAEASDIAGAVADQVDAVMLSGETAIGRYPRLAVEHMHRIAKATEAHMATLPAVPSPPARLRASRYRTAALAHGVWTVAQDIDARVIVVWSESGGGARYLSRNGFRVPIVATTSDVRVARRMELLRGVIPIRMDVPEGMAPWSERLDEVLIERRLATRGDPSVLVSGAPLGAAGVTNGLVIHTVGERDVGFAPK